ncbi:MAG: hypothetical protein J5857_01290 [Treponema sp.]|nr:hypothetical protein [Treponema sp.]
MKKLKLMAGIFVPLVILISLASCKNLIDEMEIKGYRYILSAIEDDELDRLYLYPYGAFTYKLDFATSGNTVIRTIITWDDEIDETEGTFSVDKNNISLSFPESEKRTGEKIKMPEERITLSYNKNSGLLSGNINLPQINPNTEEIMEDEITQVYGKLRAISRVSE